MKYTLRLYQIEAVQALFNYWAACFGNPVLALPTGTGKSLVIAEFIRLALTLYPGTKILVLAHVKELIEQNFEKLLEIAPTINAGIYSAGLGRKDFGRDVIFGGIGSVSKRPELFAPDIILIDECHTVSVKETTLYRKLIAALKLRKPHLKVAGLSATPYRLGQGMIIEPGGIFTDIAYDITSMEEFNNLVREGYICPLVPKKMRTELDLSEVHTVAGDYNQRELAAAVDKESITRAALAEMLEIGHDRNSWLIFASGISHCVHVANTLCEMGISAVAVHSNTKEFPMTSEARDSAVADFKGGRVRALVNNGVFTTGFDFPGIDLIGVLRPTQSPGLWVQMLGRGTRPLWLPGYDISTTEGRLACIAAGKRNCLVLDYAGNTRRLGPINDPKKPRPRGKGPKGDVPAKLCPECNTFNHVSARKCCECDFIFPIKTTLQTQSSDDDLIAGMTEPQHPICEWFDVVSVTYSKHKSWNGKRRIRGRVPETMRVSYNCGLRSFTEHKCFEHDGHAKLAARQWWIESGGGGLTIPQTIDEAIARRFELREPKKIKVWLNTKYPKIMFQEFETVEI